MTTPRFLPAVFLLALAMLTGCDTVSPGGDTILLTTEVDRTADGGPIQFSFPGTLQTGRLVDLRCNCRVDLGPYLTTQGFSRSDIVSAEVVTARLVMGTPPTGNLSFLNQALLKFESSALSATEVANRTGFLSSRESNLTVLPGRDVSAFLEKASFEPVLQVDASRLETNATYQLYLVLTVRITVSGV